ncbi:MAG: fibronectin type III domain-containing protein [Lachnospiraceae bacterium]|nr:fibronectin type III domain-containing protein [Lachnospiraceae bacterium]
MIIYISNEEKKELLDSLAEQHEWELVREVFAGESLSDYITEKLQVIQSLSYMVIDRASIKENDRELEEIIETIQCMYSTQVILLEEKLVDENGEQQKVMYGEHYTSLDKYQDDLERNIEYLLTGEKIPAEFAVDGIWIGVTSSGTGAGCTDFSIGLANFIYRYNQSVCYVEGNESGDLAAMASFYGMEKAEDNHYVKNGMDYWHQSIDQSRRFVVIDLGKYNAVKARLLSQCKIKVLIGDGKPYRMADLLNVYRQMKDDTAQVFLNLCNGADYEKLQADYSQSVSITGRVSWHDHLFENENSLYQHVMRDYIETDADNRRVSFLISGDKLKGLLKKKPKEKHIQEEKDAELEAKEEAVLIPSENWEADEMAQEESPEEVIFDDIEEVREDPEPPEPDDEFIQDILSDGDGEGNSDEDSNKADSGSRKTKRKAANTYMIWLVLVAAAAFVATTKPAIKKAVNHFFFNNQDNGQDATELVDEELNINPDIKISVLEVEGADGYEVSYSIDKNFDKKKTVVVEVETADKAVESLTAGRTYYVRVRAFKFNEDGTKVYGEYTDVQKIET